MTFFRPAIVPGSNPLAFFAAYAICGEELGGGGCFVSKSMFFSLLGIEGWSCRSVTLKHNSCARLRRRMVFADRQTHVHTRTHARTHARTPHFAFRVRVPHSEEQEVDTIDGS